MDAREAVEQMLLDRGFYSPLELLLATNRLGHEDYWAWRRGALISLDEALAGSTAEIKALLEEAEAWAQGLALDAEAMVHRGWKQNAGAELRASRHSSLNALLGRRFRRNREQGQLDIFLDGADTIAANALRDALCTRDPLRAREELERLISLHPGHEAQEQAAALIAALEMPNPEGAAQGFEQLDRLEQKWLPAASHLLGDRSRDFLAPLWIRIGKALAAVRMFAPCDASADSKPTTCRKAQHSRPPPPGPECAGWPATALPAPRPAPHRSRSASRQRPRRWWRGSAAASAAAASIR